MKFLTKLKKSENWQETQRGKSFFKRCLFGLSFVFAVMLGGVGAILSLPSIGEGGESFAQAEISQGENQVEDENDESAEPLADATTVPDLTFSMLESDATTKFTDYTMEKEGNKYTFTYTFTNQRMDIKISSYDSSYYTITRGSGFGYVTSPPTGTYIIRCPEAAGEYSAGVTLTLKSNHVWSDGSTDPVVIDVKINQRVVELPTLLDHDEDNEFQKTVVYSLKNKQVFNLQGDAANKDWINIARHSSLTAVGTDWTSNLIRSTTDAGRYGTSTVTLSLVDSVQSSICWSDGTNESKVFTLQTENFVTEMPDLAEGPQSGDGSADSPYRTEFFYDGKSKVLTFTAKEGYTFIKNGDTVTSEYQIRYGTSVLNTNIECWTFVLSSDKKTLKATYYSTSLTENSSNLYLYTAGTHCYWADGTSVHNYDIKIVTPKVAKPVLQDVDGGTGTYDDPYYKEFEYDGKTHTLTITGYNSTLMSYYGHADYWTATVSGDTLTARKTVSSASTSITNRFYIDVASAIWEDGTNDRIYFNVVINKRVIPTPTLVEGIVGGSGTSTDPYYAELEFDGSQKSINLTLPDGHKFYTESTNIDNVNYPTSSSYYTFKVSEDRRTLTATLTSSTVSSSLHTIRLVVTDTSNCTFESGVTNLYFALKIVSPSVAKPVLQDVDGGSGTANDPYYKEFVYDGQNHSLTITGVNEAIMDITASESRWKYTVSDGVMTLTRLESNVATAGSYTASINVKSSASWDDGTEGAVYFKVVIKRQVISDPVLQNEIVGGDGTSASPYIIQKEYDKNSLVVSFSNYDKTYVNCSISTTSTSYPQVYDEANKTFTITRVSPSVGSYTFNLALANANYAWADGSIENKYYSFTIIKKVISAPSMSNHDLDSETTKTLVYDEATHQFVFENVVDEIVRYAINNSVANGNMALVSWENNTLTLGASNVCVYTLTFELSDINNYVWADTNDAVSRVFVVKILKQELDVPEIVGNDGSNSVTFEYDGNPHEVQISGITEGYVDFELPAGMTNKGLNDGILTVEVTNSGTYTLNLRVKDFDNFKWQGLENNLVAYTISVGSAKVAKPTLQGDLTGETTMTVDFNVDGSQMVIEGVTDAMVYTLPDGMTLVSYENNVLTVLAVNAGTYNVSISLKDDNFTWADGTSTALTFSLKINRILVALPYLEETGEFSGVVVTKTYTGEWFEFKIHAKSDGCLTWRNVRDAEFEFVSWENDILTLRAKTRGTYRVYIEHASTTNTRWDLTTGSAPTGSTSYAYFTLTINKQEVARPVLASDSDTGSVYYKNGEYYYLKIENVPKGIFQYNFTATDMELESWENDVLILKAKDVASYAAVLTLVDTQNYRVIDSSTSTPTYTFKLTIKKYSHALPTYQGDRTKVYNGEKQEFVIINMFKEWDKYSAPAGVEEVSWTDDGVLTLRMKDVGTYDIYLSVIDPDNCKWMGNYNSYTEVTRTFKISTASVTASVSFYSTDSNLQGAFDSGSYTWPAGSAVWGVVTLNGLNPNDHPELNVYYYWSNDSAKKYPLEEDTSMGVYYFKFPERFSPGGHYIMVDSILSEGGMANYKLAKRVSVRFYINTAIADFEDSDLIWQYKNNNQTVVVGSEVGTQENPLDLAYNGKAYSFSITKTSAELQTLGVKISSYTGNTAATEASDTVYCAKVTIVAYSTKFFYNTKTFEIYYKIGKVKIDLSGIKWNYSSPLIYNGNAQNVYINGSTLPSGLSVKGYSGDVDMVNATEGTGKKYVTTVEFAVSSQSYIVPDMNDPESYIGTFSWSVEWEINKATINVSWKQGKVVTEEGAFEVPVLATGNAFVNYSFEQQGDDGEFFAIDKLVKVPGKAVNYRVTATLKDGTGSEDEVNYAQNYKLVVNDSVNNPNPIGFTIGKDQYPVQVGIEINGVIIDINEEGVSTNIFPYTGNQYVAKPVVFSGDLSIENFTVTYYSSSSVKGSTIAPTDVGTYRVVVTITYKTSGSYDSDDYFIEGNNEFEFEITKANFDLSNLKWQYSHNGVVVATYDSLQDKWLDEMGREVSPMRYDGSLYQLSLLGINDISGLSIRLSGAEGTDVGNYVAHADFTYNSQNYNKPVLPDLNWNIEKGVLDVSGVHWSYEGAFVYDYVGGNSVVYKVELVGLPEYLKDKISYTTNGLAGNSASNVGEYITSFVLGEIDSSRYSEVVWPENLISEITWEILQKRLFTPEYKFAMGEDDEEEKIAWEFDAQIHDLLSLFTGIDSSVEDYYNVIIEYASDNLSFVSYGGYAGNKFSAIYAGTYRVVFAIKDGINNGVNNVVWGNGKASNQVFRVLVSKTQIIITGWNEADEDSTIILDKGEGFNHVFKYNYLDEAEKIIPIDYIYNSVGGETFFITPALKDEFKNSVEFDFASDVPEKISFVTEGPGESEDPPIRFEKPEADTIVIVFDNLVHTLQISDWISNWDELKDYMAIVENDSDSLTQFAVGKYTIVLRFNKDAYVSWKTENESMLDRSTLTLQFEIITKVLEVPEIPKYTYTGDVVDVSDNFDEDFENFVTFISGNLGTNVNEYTLVLSLKNPENTTWSDGTTDDKRITWEIVPCVLDLPTINKTLIFDGAEHNVVEILDGFNAEIMKISPEGSHAIDAGNYVATITLTNDNYVWAENNENVLINWEIAKFKVAKPSIDSSSSIVYDGEAHNVTSLLKDYDPSLMVITSGEDRGTDAKVYKITISLPSDNYVWADDTADSLEFGWEIKQRVLNVSEISNDTFDNSVHNILEALGLTLDDLNFLSLNATFNGEALTKYEWFNAGTYALILTIDSAFNVNGDNVIFGDNTTEAKSISFVIEKLNITVSGWNKDNENSTAIFENQTIPKNMIDYVIVDSEGNVVSKEDVANAGDGSEFTIKLVLKSEFENNVELNYLNESIKQYTFIVSEDPTKVWIPTINDIIFTGDEIDIWETISNTIGDKVDVVSGNLGTNAGEYTLVLSLKDKTGTTWIDGSTDDVEVTWKIVALKLDIPKNNGSFVVFDNQEHNLLEVCGVGQLSKYLNVSVKFNNEEFATENFLAKNHGVYTLTFEIKDEFNSGSNINVCWSDDSTSVITVEIVVSKLIYNVDGWNENNENSTIKSDTDVINQDFLSYVITDEEGNIVTIQDVINANGQGKTFIVKVSVEDEFAQNVELNFAEGVLDTFEFTTSLDEAEKVEKPTISSEKIEYNKDEHNVNEVLVGFDETKMEFGDNSQLVATDANTYTIVISLKEGYAWADGSKDDITLTWEISKAVISGTWNQTGLYPVFECENELYQCEVIVKFFDQDENPVTQLQEGVEYIARVELSDNQNYELSGVSEISFTFGNKSESKLFEVKETNTTFKFVFGDGEDVVYSEHSYNPDSPIYLKNIAYKDTLQDIANQFKNLGIRFFSKDGEEISGDTNLASGIKLRLYSGEDIIDELILVLKGDVNGDGEIDMLDKAILNAYVSGEIVLDDEFKLASDTNDDGEIDMLDKASLNAFTSGTIDFFEGLSVKVEEIVEGSVKPIISEEISGNATNNDSKNRNMLWIWIVFGLVASSILVLLFGISARRKKSGTRK